MTERRKIYFTVTNDLSFDQRMIRICRSLSDEYDVTLVGRTLKRSLPLSTASFAQKRLSCLFNRGFLFYAEYNLRLFFFLFFRKIDVVCAIDLDTIMPCYFISKLKKIPRVYDAHELFCEMKEIVTRPSVYRVWKRIEKTFVPRFRQGYTVNETIAKEFYEMYGSAYGVIRNLPVLHDLVIPEKKEKYIIYQGAVNEGRCFEILIPAMRRVNASLVICGDGNFMEQTVRLVNENGLEAKVIFKGRIAPAELWKYTIGAWAGVTLFESGSRNNYLSLGNRFFDYMHAGIPQVCVNYPEYERLNETKPFALLIDTVTESSVSAALNRLLDDGALSDRLQQNALEARLTLNWQQEEKKLIAFYKELF